MAEIGHSSQALRYEQAQRLAQLPPYIFVELDGAKRALEAQGKDVIDLGVGDPDLPTPAHIIEELKRSVDYPANHRYSMTEGMPRLRKAIAGWYATRFNVQLDVDRQILPLLGSKEGIAHFPLAVANPGDCVLVPDPGYPPYGVGSILAGAEPVPMPLLEKNEFFPNLRDISRRTARRAKVMFLNYPNNPTAALAGNERFQEAIDFAKKYHCAIAHDAAYSEIVFDGERPISILQLPGAKSVCIEFHSLSKTWNMTGWRIGWACGNEDLISALRKLKTNLDSGIFQPIQLAGIAALEGGSDVLRETVATYKNRREVLVDGLARLGWHVTKPSAGLYVWSHVPTQESSMVFAERVLKQSHVIVAPGTGFGPSGEGYVRMSLTVRAERIEEAVSRLKKSL